MLFPGAPNTNCDLPAHLRSFQNCFLFFNKFFSPRVAFPLRSAFDVGLQKNDDHLVVHMLLNPDLFLSLLSSYFPHSA